MCGAPASKASVAGRYNRDLPIPDSGRRKVLSVPTSWLASSSAPTRIPMTDGRNAEPSPIQGSERRFATPPSQRFNIMSSCIMVIQSYSHTVVGDASISSVNWLWVPVSPFEGKFRSIFIQMSSSTRTLG